MCRLLSLRSSARLVFDNYNLYLSILFYMIATCLLFFAVSYVLLHFSIITKSLFITPLPEARQPFVPRALPPASDSPKILTVIENLTTVLEEIHSIPETIYVNPVKTTMADVTDSGYSFYSLYIMLWPYLNPFLLFIMAVAFFICVACFIMYLYHKAKQRWQQEPFVVLGLISFLILLGIACLIYVPHFLYQFSCWLAKLAKAFHQLFPGNVAVIKETDRKSVV